MTNSRTIRASSLALFAALVTASCSGPNDYRITTMTQADAIMGVAMNPPTPVPADGVSLVTITITLAPGAKSNDRVVTLTTTAGTFVPSSANNASQAMVT